MNRFKEVNLRDLRCGDLTAWGIIVSISPECGYTKVYFVLPGIAGTPLHMVFTAGTRLLIEQRDKHEIVEQN